MHDTLEEIFVLMLQALGDRHIRPGFERAADQMHAYRPAEHEETNSVAPLLQFFELVHIGDTMQSMVQVYFDKELVRIPTVVLLLTHNLTLLYVPRHRISTRRIS